MVQHSAINGRTHHGTDSAWELEAHLHGFIDAYNYGRWLKTPKCLTLFEYICKIRIIELNRSNPSNAGTKQFRADAFSQLLAWARTRSMQPPIAPAQRIALPVHVPTPGGMLVPASDLSESQNRSPSAAKPPRRK